MLALLCSGQGKQNRRMFDLFIDAPEAEPVFAVANEVLGEDLRHLVCHGDDDTLQRNRVSQLLNVTRALMAHACLAPALPRSLLVAGYSVGEMAAWGVAGVWSVADTLVLTGRRAELMDRASTNNDALGFVRGLSNATVEAMAAGCDCEIAIINPDLLFIVGGVRDQVMALCDQALQAGAAHSGLLPVHVASHTSRLRSAVEPFEQALRAVVPLRLPSGRKLLGATDATSIFHPAAALGGLASQLACTIDWNAVLIALVEQNADRMLELGPGSVLSEMVHAAHPSVRVRALDDFHSLEGAKAWLND